MVHDSVRIDLSTFPRRKHYEYFAAMANPYVGLTVQVNISPLFKRVKKEQLPFFLSMLYALGNAANSIPQMRQRIIDGGITEFSACDSSYTVALPDDTYCYCEVDTQQPFDRFLLSAKEAQKQAAQAASVSDEDPDTLFFVSSVPWISYTALTLPTPFPADSNPRFTLGRYTVQNDEMVLLPVSVLAHHALVDGLHIARFYDALGRMIDDIGNGSSSI